MTQSYNQVSGTYDFGSVVRALQAQIAASGGTVKEYPYNFEGITKAIQDLTFAEAGPNASDIGPKPSNGDVVIDENGVPQFNYTTAPVDGAMWFDTRQGRLFIAYESQWYQTNGGDGFPVVTETDVPPAATNLVIGQMWYDRVADVLYIFAGQYRETNGTIVTTPTATTVPVWDQLLAAGGQQTSVTLPIGDDAILTALLPLIASTTAYIPSPNLASITHQDNLNDFLTEAVILLDRQTQKQQPTVSITPPTNPQVGQFWFDSSTIEMSIWYSAPGDAWGQWVPVFSPAKLDDNLNTLKAGLSAETSARRAETNTLQGNIDTLEDKVFTNDAKTNNTLSGLQSQINAIPTVDLSPYVTTVQEQSDIKNLQNQVNAARADITLMYSGFVTQGALTSTQQTLQSNIDAKADQTALTAAIATIPSVTGLASETYVNNKIAANTGLTQNGGTLIGTITVNKNDIADPAFDYSTHYYDGQLAQKYRTNCQMVTPHYATFGTNEQLYEYAWDFTDNEDFCWIHGTNGKVASIDKNGIAATNLYVATFGTNTNDGRQLTSTIDVGARLATYQTALESLRTNAATATTLDQLKTAIANALANV